VLTCWHVVQRLQAELRIANTRVLLVLERSCASELIRGILCLITQEQNGFVKTGLDRDQIVAAKRHDATTTRSNLEEKHLIHVGACIFICIRDAQYTRFHRWPGQ